MAVPASFAESNRHLAKPPSMTHEECEALAVADLVFPNEIPAVLSCWKLTQEELAEINRTNRVWLIVVGETMAPVQVHGIKPISDA